MQFLVSYYYPIENLLLIYNIALSHIATIPGTAAPGQPPLLLYPTTAIPPKSPTPGPSGNKRTASTLFIANEGNNKRKKIASNSSITREKRRRLQLQCISAMQNAQTGLIAALNGLQASTEAWKQLLELDMEVYSE